MPLNVQEINVGRQVKYPFTSVIIVNISILIAFVQSE